MPREERSPTAHRWVWARRLVLTGAVALLAGAWYSATSLAAVTIGSTGDPGGVTCASNGGFVQVAVAPSTASYTAPVSGVITSWSTFANGTAGYAMKLKVLRLQTGTTYLVVGDSGFQPIQASGVHPIPARVAIRTGDTIALKTAAATNIGCVFSGTSADAYRHDGSGPDPPPNGLMSFPDGPTTFARVNLSAVIEPDADGDVFGDETQDLCPGVAGTMNGCPPADLAVSETASPNPSPVHGRFSYLVRVHNNGPSALPAGQATLADTVAPSETLVSASSPGGACTPGPPAHCPVAALAPGADTTIAVAVRANGEGGIANAATVSYGGDTNPANNSVGFTATVVPAPSISTASVSPKTWRLGSALPKFSRRAHVGTTIRFSLTQPATATLTFSQPKAGRKVRGRCRSLTRANRRKPRCTIANVRGSLILSAHAGTNKVRFQGRLSRSKKLKPGRYTLTITATDSAGNRSNAKATRFTIVRR